MNQKSVALNRLLTCWSIISDKKQYDYNKMKNPRSLNREWQSGARPEVGLIWIIEICTLEIFLGTHLQRLNTDI